MLQENSGLSYTSISGLSAAEGSFRESDADRSSAGLWNSLGLTRAVSISMMRSVHRYDWQCANLQAKGRYKWVHLANGFVASARCVASLSTILPTATKIGTRLLRALEEEHFELLPGGIFNKGFVRAYAKYLGLNEEEAVADYLEAAGEASPDPRVIAEQNSSRIDRSGGDARPSRQAGFPIIPVLILLLVIAAGAGGWQIYQERVRDGRQNAASQPRHNSGRCRNTGGDDSCSAPRLQLHCARRTNRWNAPDRQRNARIGQVPTPAHSQSIRIPLAKLAIRPPTDSHAVSGCRQVNYAGGGKPGVVGE